MEESNSVLSYDQRQNTGPYITYEGAGSNILVKQVILSPKSSSNLGLAYTFIQGNNTMKIQYNNVHLRLSEFQFHINIYLLKDFHYLHQKAS